MVVMLLLLLFATSFLFLYLMEAECFVHLLTHFLQSSSSQLRKNPLIMLMDSSYYCSGCIFLLLWIQDISAMVNMLHIRANAIDWTMYKLFSASIYNYRVKACLFHALGWYSRSCNLIAKKYSACGCVFLLRLPFFWNCLVKSHVFPFMTNLLPAYNCFH